MSLQAPEQVQKLQTVLHAKAKESPGFRFYALYDKVYRDAVLAHAWRCSRANGGAAGVDGERFEDIEAYSAERWLGGLAEGLRSKAYQAQPVRRVMIPKANGQSRSLGIPTIRDRVVQTARCGSWNQSSRPICSRSSMPTGPGAARTMPCATWTGW